MFAGRIEFGHDFKGVVCNAACRDAVHNGGVPGRQCPIPATGRVGPTNWGESNMSSTLSRRHIVQLALGATAALGRPASAHHGWSWAEEEQSTLTGTIVSVSMAPPHPQLNVKAADGVAWLIDLGNPNQTERSGFTAASAKPGDAVVVLGNRDKDKSKMHMKAVRITVAGKQYDMYPERIRTN